MAKLAWQAALPIESCASSLGHLVSFRGAVSDLGQLPAPWHTWQQCAMPQWACKTFVFSWHVPCGTPEGVCSAPIRSDLIWSDLIYCCDLLEVTLVSASHNVCNVWQTRALPLPHFNANGMNYRNWHNLPFITAAGSGQRKRGELIMLIVCLHIAALCKSA